MPVIDQSAQGKRVKLVRWDRRVVDIRIRPGDLGTATSWTIFDLGHNREQRTLQVQWDNGPEESLVEGQDQWEWVD